METPLPGSEEAIKFGCVCHVYASSETIHVAMECPVHGTNRINKTLDKISTQYKDIINELIVTRQSRDVAMKKLLFWYRLTMAQFCVLILLASGLGFTIWHICNCK